MESSFFRKEISPLIRDSIVDNIDLYGKEHRTLVEGLSESKLNRLALAFWTEAGCDREFLNEGCAGNEALNTVCRIALRDPQEDHLSDIGRITIKLLVSFYAPRMQECLDLMHDELREQIEAEEYIESGHRQIVDEQTGERRWIK